MRPPSVVLCVLLLENLAALGRSTWQLDEGFGRGAGELVKCTIDRVRAARDYNERGRPLLVPQLASGWPAVSNSTRWWSEARLRKLAHGAKHAVRWPVGQRAFGLVSAECGLDAYLDSTMMRSAPWPETAISSLMFGRTNVGVDEEDWMVPELFANRQLSSRILSVGRSGAGLGLHNHGEAFEAIIIGHKLVVFLPPLPNKLMATTDATTTARLRLLSMSVGQLVALPAAQRDALLIAGGWNTSDFTSCVLSPGDAVWIPCNYYHGTMNIGDTVAVGSQKAQKKSDEAMHGRDCPNDVFSLAAAQLSKAADLISAAEGRPALSSGRPDRSQVVLLQMLDKADDLLRKTTSTLAMNVEAALWAGRSAFLRRRVSGSCEDEEHSALLRLNSTALMWTSAARLSAPHTSLSAPNIHVAHAAAVLTGIGRHLVAEMRRRVQQDDTADGWDNLTYLAYTIQRQATALLSESDVGSLSNHDQLVVQAMKAIVAMTTVEFLVEIGQPQLAGREAVKALQFLDRWAEADWVPQVVHSPPAESVLSLQQSRNWLKEAIELASDL